MRCRKWIPGKLQDLNMSPSIALSAKAWALSPHFMVADSLSLQKTVIVAEAEARLATVLHAKAQVFQRMLNVRAAGAWALSEIALTVPEPV